MLCILYVSAMGAGFGIVGLLLERAVPVTMARRWIWCLVIPMSVFIPGYYRFHHNWSVTDAFQQQSAHTTVADPIARISLSALNPEMWTHVAGYDGIIHWSWITGSSVLVLLGLANAWRVWRIVSLSRRRQKQIGGTSIVDGVPVLVTDLVGPATVGVVNSRVVVPQWVLALPAADRQYVLRHEEEHRTSHDALLLFVASLTLILMPWNPALWWHLRRLCLAVEMDCDNRVVKRLGDPTAYGQLLLKVAEASSVGPRLQPALLGGMGSLERRLTALLAPTPLRHAQRYVLPAVAALLLVVILSMPHPVLGTESGAHGAAVHQTMAPLTASATHTR